MDTYVDAYTSDAMSTMMCVYVTDLAVFGGPSSIIPAGGCRI